MYSIHQKNISVLAATDLPQWASSTTAGGTNNSYFNQTVTDSQGNIYTVGYIDGTGIYNLGNGVTVSGGYSSHNAIIVKYNSSGQAQWANSTALSGPYYSNFANLTIDSDDNIYAVGYITGKGIFNLGNGVTVSGGTIGDNAFIAKYNSSGQAQWAKSTTSGANSTYYGIVVDSNNDVFASGAVSGGTVTNFGNSVTVTGGAAVNNAVLVKYNSSGLTQWAKTTASGAPGGSNFYGLAIDSNDNLYAVGNIGSTGTYNFGNSVTVSGGYSVNNPVIVKYNSSGLAQWANSTALGGPANSFFYGVAVDSNDNPHAVGFIYTTGTFNFGNSVTVNGGYSTYNAAVVKYNSSGLAQWANSTALGGPSSSYFYNIAIDANNFVYCSGQISSNGQYNFGNSITVNGTYPGGYNATLVKYNSSGLAQLAKSTVTAPSTSNFNGISIDSTGKVYAVGSINTANTYNFGNSVTVSGGYSGGANAVIVKYDTEAIVPTPTPTPTSTQNQNSQNNSSSTSTTSSTPVCTDIKPLSVPDLFQINVTDTTAKIHFTPAKETNTYYVGFSEDLNAEKHGAQATLLTEGVQSYTIFKLKPNTIYYFKVKAQNGCTAGDWSNIMKIKTNPKNSSKINIFYKNYSLIQSITKIKSNQITETKNISADITPVITSTPQKEKVTPPTNQTTEIPKPEPKKLCIFKWCF